MKTIETKIIKIPVDQVKEHERNPRIHPESAIEKLTKSIARFGWTAPVLISKDNILLAGHARLKAAKESGINEIPAIKLNLSGAKADAYMVADNRLHEETSWDEDKLKSIITFLHEAGADLNATAFNTAELDAILDRDIEDFSLPETEPEYDESISEDVETIVCEGCGYEFPI